jgi:hypothetical protein
LSLNCRQYLFVIVPNSNHNNQNGVYWLGLDLRRTTLFSLLTSDMRRRERALTTEIRLNLNSDDKLSGMSPIFAHRMINLSPMFHIRNNNYLVRA